ncbi:hypothetical protein [Paludisphaera soli]|uniref:hypothetical protein n=1 Tax=Paludisphaera soli TaxID=2712865 RepID=UPI0013ED79F1|nr:hypothetical protein [Paludisphaera soli]
MIIECPNCGFSGRLPDHATLAPHQARCPKCRSRFDVGALAAQAAEPSGRADLRHDLARPRLDPSESSYELDPLNDFADAATAWDEPWADDDPIEPAAPRAATPARLVDRVPAWAFRPSVWRIRLFQAWAVLLLLGATIIFARIAIAALTFDDARFFSDELLRPVAAVVLLVTAAALLCLSVDVSRRLARSTYAPTNPPPPSPPHANGNGVAPPLRSLANGRHD